MFRRSSVNRRAQEIGIRMALGASARNVRNVRRQIIAGTLRLAKSRDDSRLSRHDCLRHGLARGSSHLTRLVRGFYHRNSQPI